MEDFYFMVDSKLIIFNRKPDLFITQKTNLNLI